DPAQLQALLSQLSPEQLQQLLAMVQGGGAAGGGLPGAGGAGGGQAGPGVDDMSDAMMEMGQSPEGLEAMAPKAATTTQAEYMRKLASAVRQRRASGEYAFTAATTPEQMLRRKNAR